MGNISQWRRHARGTVTHKLGRWLAALAAAWAGMTLDKADAGTLWDAGPIALQPRTSLPVKPLEERWIFEMESGFLWKVTDETPLDYALAPQIVSLRAPRHFGGDALGGSWEVRPQFSLLAEAVVDGPESHYLGFSASPVAEWRSAGGNFSIFASAGGGFGWVDSQDVVGAQGQDFTLNWFAKSGLRFRVSGNWRASCAVFFQHLSNRGMTDPNPGLDALGVLFGFSRPL